MKQTPILRFVRLAVHSKWNRNTIQLVLYSAQVSRGRWAAFLEDVMLVSISQSNLSDVNKIGVSMIRGWDAVDTENFAYLHQTNGRGKYGLPKFILVLFVDHPENFEDTLKAYTDLPRMRSIIRVWSLEEAIEIANKRLPRLQKRAQQTGATRSLPPDPTDAEIDAATDEVIRCGDDEFLRRGG
jgi:hypothetical protein